MDGWGGAGEERCRGGGAAGNVGVGLETRGVRLGWGGLPVPAKNRRREHKVLGLGRRFRRRAGGIAPGFHTALEHLGWERFLVFFFSFFLFFSLVNLFSCLLCSREKKSVQSRGNFVQEEFCQLSAAIRITGKNAYMVKWYFLSPLE